MVGDKEEEVFCHQLSPFYFKLLKYGACALSVSCVLALVAIFHWCPLSWSRERIIKTALAMKRKKRKGPQYLDSRSISANTEFDYFAVATNGGSNHGEDENHRITSFSIFDQQQQKDIGNNDNNTTSHQHHTPLTSDQPTKRLTEFITSSTSADNLSRGNQPTNVTATQSKHNTLTAANKKNDNRQSFPTATLNRNLSSSYDQFYHQYRNKKTSVVTFEMDNKDFSRSSSSSKKQKQSRFKTSTRNLKNLHRTITKSISQPVEVNVHGNYQQKHNNNNNNNNNSINTNRITTINTPEQIRMPKAGKIASSIQDLTTSSMVATGLNSSNNYYNEMIRSTSGSNFSKFSTSEPDLQNRIVYDDNNYHSTAQTANEAGGYHYKNNNNNNNNNNDIGFDTYYKSLSHLNKREGWNDEGQMQCIFEYDIERSILKVKELLVQAVFPPGVPGFVVEIGLEPRALVVDVKRSKVYVAVEQRVEVRLAEIFQIICTKEQLKQCAIVISVIPIFGNMALVVETGLDELNLIANGEIFLGGLFRGLYSETF